MYVAFEGTNELLKNKLFAQCLEFYKNRNKNRDNRITLVSPNNPSNQHF